MLSHTILLCAFFFYRGSDFRKEYGKLGDSRGYFPPCAHIMALTATASPATRRDVIKILGMKKPHMIIRCPNNANIIYSVDKKYAIVFKPLIEELKLKRMNMDKVIIFCRSYKDCSSIYFYFKDSLKGGLTDPVGYPNVAKFRIVDMLSACNSSSVKNQILHTFSQPNGRLRVVIPTIAFGMGIDCPNIRRIIHWGPPSDIEGYIQETGRAGRDGHLSFATIYYSKTELSLPYMDSAMVTYCQNNNTSRRELLFRVVLLQTLPPIRGKPSGDEPNKKKPEAAAKKKEKIKSFDYDAWSKFDVVSGTLSYVTSFKH